MEQTLDLIREQQKETWNKFSPGWKQWDDLTMDFLKPMGNEIISALQLKDNDVVLDVAAGTGEPGLTIAAIVKNGQVVMTDLAEGMLEVARENAAKRGLTNVETELCDACNLPYADDTFDAISCRFGFMFFPDMLLAAKEMVRVLRPGGKIATTVWGGPDKNFWITATMGPLSRNMELPAPPPGSPGIFRCAKEGLIADLFRQAGLRNVTESEVQAKLNTGTAHVYWDFMTAVVAPVVAALGKADEQLKTKIKTEVLDAVNSKYPGGNVAIDGSAILICGEK